MFSYPRINNPLTTYPLSHFDYIPPLRKYFLLSANTSTESIDGPLIRVAEVGEKVYQTLKLGPAIISLAR